MAVILTALQFVLNRTSDKTKLDDARKNANHFFSDVFSAIASLDLKVAIS